MRRLLQGDVGSGKTVVALYCLVRAAEAGLQGVLLAPTETLAAQHAETTARLVGPLASAELVTASLTAKERRATLARLASGETRIAIGTHALLQGDVEFAELALLVVDEQHRFGVEQRDALLHRAARRRRRAARAAHDRDADPAHARPHRVRRPRRHHHRRRAFGTTAGRHPPGGRGQARGRLRLRAQADRPRQAGLRRLPGHRRVRVHHGRDGDRRGRAAAGRAVSRRARRGGARPAQVGGARRRHARLQERRARRAGSDQPHRGRHRRAQRHGDDRRGRRAFRARAAPSAARARRPRQREVVLPAVRGGRDRHAHRRGSRRCSRPTTASSSPTRTSRSAARGR